MAKNDSVAPCRIISFKKQNCVTYLRIVDQRPTEIGSIADQYTIAGVNELKEQTIKRLSKLNLNAGNVDDKFDECVSIFKEELAVIEAM